MPASCVCCSRTGNTLSNVCVEDDGEVNLEACKCNDSVDGHGWEVHGDGGVLQATNSTATGNKGEDAAATYGANVTQFVLPACTPSAATQVG